MESALGQFHLLLREFPYVPAVATSPSLLAWLSSDHVPGADGVGDIKTAAIQAAVDAINVLIRVYSPIGCDVKDYVRLKETGAYPSRDRSVPFTLRPGRRRRSLWRPLPGSATRSSGDSSVQEGAASSKEGDAANADANAAGAAGGDAAAWPAAEDGGEGEMDGAADGDESPDAAVDEARPWCHWNKPTPTW